MGMNIIQRAIDGFASIETWSHNAIVKYVQHPSTPNMAAEAPTEEPFFEKAAEKRPPKIPDIEYTIMYLIVPHDCSTPKQKVI